MRCTEQYHYQTDPLCFIINLLNYLWNCCNKIKLWMWQSNLKQLITLLIVISKLSSLLEALIYVLQIILFGTNLKRKLSLQQFYKLSLIKICYLLIKLCWSQEKVQNCDSFKKKETFTRKSCLLMKFLKKYQQN